MGLNKKLLKDSLKNLLILKESLNKEELDYQLLGQKCILIIFESTHQMMMFNMTNKQIYLIKIFIDKIAKTNRFYSFQL